MKNEMCGTASPGKGEKVAEGRMSDGLKQYQVADSKFDNFEFLSGGSELVVRSGRRGLQLGASPQTPEIF